MRLNGILDEDCAYVVGSNCVDWERLEGKTILVTGATGLIGSHVVRTLAYADERMDLGLSILALVRSVHKARAVLGEEVIDAPCVSVLEGDVMSLLSVEGVIDFVIHAASPTASRFFMSNPVETLRTALLGTDNMLQLAKDRSAEGFIFLSSMEVYGTVCDEAPLKEGSLGSLDPLATRSCYPEGKRACEALVAAYASEYGLRAMSVRLAQTFGPGVPADDRRVFAMMARCVMLGEDIVLQTKGESRNPYLYTAQAVEAILCVLLRGEAGTSYNAANPDTYCSIAEMGEMVARDIAGSRIRVRFAEDGEAGRYPPTRYWKLDTSRLEALGWVPRGSLGDMYRRMMETM